jgi:hypothetical protein
MVLLWCDGKGKRTVCALRLLRDKSMSSKLRSFGTGAQHLVFAIEI